MEHEMVTIGPCKGLLEAVTLFGSKASVKRKVRDLQFWHRSNLAQRVPRVWRGQVLDRHRDFALRQHELEPQWTIPSDFEKWSDGSPMFALARLAGTAKRTAVHCGRTVSWLQGPSGMPRAAEKGTRWVVSSRGLQCFIWGACLLSCYCLNTGNQHWVEDSLLRCAWYACAVNDVHLDSPAFPGI